MRAKTIIFETELSMSAPAKARATISNSPLFFSRKIYISYP
jgi:hypothetical protein